MVQGVASPTKQGIDLETIQWAEGAQSGAGVGGSGLLLGEAVKGLVPSPAGRREDPLHLAPSAASLDKLLEVEDSDDSQDLAAMYLSAADKSMPLPPEPAVAVPVAISPGKLHYRAMPTLYNAKLEQGSSSAVSTAMPKTLPFDAHPDLYALRDLGDGMSGTSSPDVRSPTTAVVFGPDRPVSEYIIDEISSSMGSPRDTSTMGEHDSLGAKLLAD